MTDTQHTRLEAVKDRMSSLTIAQVIVVIALCLAVLMGVAIAQTGQQTYSDDFEDGNSGGWENDELGIQPDMSTDSIAGSWSIYADTSKFADTGAEQPAIQWVDGPVLDMEEDFRIEGTFKPNSVNADSSWENNIRIGVTGTNQSQEGENAYLIFNAQNGQTYLGTYHQDEPQPGDEVIDTSFNNEWVQFAIESDAEEDTLRAKVWSLDEQEPTEWQLEKSGFSGTSGLFGFNVGFSPEEYREAWLDDVTIDGREATDPNLELDAPVLIKHGESGSYSVDYTTEDNRTTDVTSEATVQSLNEDALTVDGENNRLIATENTEFNERVEVRAEYNGSVTYAEVAVAEVTLENADILPTMFRFAALFDNGNFFFILLATLGGIVGTRWSTSFGGLGFFEIILVIGWLGGWVQGGLMLVSVFFAGFIGLNLAANIDYTVRR